MLEIRTARLILRRPVKSDLDDLHALDSDTLVMRWINGGIAVSRDDFERSLLPVFLTYSPASPLGFWLLRSDGRFAGWVSLRPTGTRGEAELGYRLAASAWGQGYAVEAARALIDRARQDAGIRRVIATTYEENLASQRVLEKLGFSIERRFQMTSAKLAESDTSVPGAHLWPGDDLLFSLTI